MDHLLPAVVEGLPVAVFVLDRGGRPVYANRAAVELLGKGADPSLRPEDLARGYQARLAGTDEPYPAERMPIVRALAGETATVSDMEIHLDERVTAVEVWAAPITADDGSVAYAVAAFQDISERKHAERMAAVLNEETIRQSRWLAAVREVQFAILAGADFDAALELVAQRAREVIGADGAIIGLPAGDGMLDIRAAVGEAADQLRGQRPSLADSIMGAVIDMDAPALLDDAASHGGIADPIAKLDFGPAVFVPLTASGGAMGSLCLARRRGSPLFTDREVAAAEAFAVQAAMAVQNGEAPHTRARDAVLGDRRRTVHGLHKMIVESLSVVQDSLSAVAAASSDRTMQARADDAVVELDSVVRQLAGYAAALRRTAAAAELERALRVVAAEFEARTGVVTLVEMDGDAAAASPSVTSEIIQIVDLILSNVARHAAASTCRIGLARTGRRFALAVDDDGRGFAPSLPGPTGGGLSVLAELVASLGGTLQVVSAVGEGTRVSVSLTADEA